MSPEYFPVYVLPGICKLVSFSKIITLSLLAKSVMRSADQNCILAIFVLHAKIYPVRSPKLNIEQVATSNISPKSYYF